MSTAEVNASIDGSTARFTLTAVSSDPNLDEIKIEYCDLGTGTWTRSAAFSSNAVGQTVDIAVDQGANYIARVVSIDTSGNETFNGAIEFTPTDPTDGTWTERTSDYTTPVWTERT